MNKLIPNAYSKAKNSYPHLFVHYFLFIQMIAAKYHALPLYKKNPQTFSLITLIISVSSIVTMLEM